jgi:hypothetical protein
LATETEKAYAAAFLRQVLPFLKIKQLRAQCGIELGENTYTRVNGKGKRGYFFMTDEQRARREELALIIRRENCRSNVAKGNSNWGVN